MRVFVIPSWYPTKASPLAGVFIQEQVEALADLGEDVEVVVSTWGHDAGVLSPRHPLATLRAVGSYVGHPGTTISASGGLVQTSSRSLSWSRRLPFDSLRSIVGANRANLRRVLNDLGAVDLMHAHVSYPGGYVASVLSAESGIPFVLTEHMSPFPFPELLEGSKPIPEIEQAFNEASRSMAVSPSAANAIAAFGFPRPCAIPNLIDERKFTPGHPVADKFRFLTVALIGPQKGLDVLLCAIAHWDPDPDEFEFWIAGDGPELKDYVRLTATLGVDDRVSWIGRVSRSDAPDLFRGCHAFVLPSRHESFGVVLIEAAASGKPVIATRCGGPESIVTPATGMLVEKNDVAALAEAMQEMATKWSEYDPATIRHEFEQRFSRAPVVARLMSLYRDVLISHGSERDP